MLSLEPLVLFIYLLMFNYPWIHEFTRSQMERHSFELHRHTHTYTRGQMGMNNVATISHLRFNGTWQHLINCNINTNDAPFEFNKIWKTWKCYTHSGFEKVIWSNLCIQMCVKKGLFIFNVVLSFNHPPFIHSWFYVSDEINFIPSVFFVCCFLFVVFCFKKEKQLFYSLFSFGKHMMMIMMIIIIIITMEDFISFASVWVEIVGKVSLYSYFILYFALEKEP